MITSACSTINEARYSSSYRTEFSYRIEFCATGIFPSFSQNYSFWIEFTNDTSMDYINVPNCSWLVLVDLNP